MTQHCKIQMMTVGIFRKMTIIYKKFHFTFINSILLSTSFQFHSDLTDSSEGKERRTFPNDTKVLVQEEFLRGVNDLILEYRYNSNESSFDDGNDILINYMTWRLISEFYPNQPIDEAERKSKCLKDTEDMFAPAVTAMFVESKGTFNLKS